MKIEYVEIIDSTNEEMKRRKEKKEFEILYAGEQTNGKGRRGNVWISNKGAALFTFTLEDKNYNESIPLFIGDIVYKELLKIIDSRLLKFKWPNDIYYEGKKLCGILVEKSENFLIIGIGINVNNVDFGVYTPNVTSLKLIKGSEYNIEKLILNIVENVKINIIEIKENWIDIIASLNMNHMLNDKQVINDRKEEYYIKNINLDGSLKVKKMNSEKYINIYSDEIKGIKIK